MEKKYTNKEVKNLGMPIVSISANAIQSLLAYTPRNGWTESRTYGWRSDIYIIDGVVISTGYAPVKGTRLPSQLIDKYEAEAMAILSTSENPEKEILELLNAFILEVKGIL
jgi:hypothetical protein